MFKVLSPLAIVVKRFAANGLPSEVMLAAAIVALSLSSLSSAGLTIH